MVATANDHRGQKPLIRLTATIFFDGMTWADLREFVSIADRNGIDDGDTVDLYYENEDFYSPLGLEVAFYSAGSDE